MKRFLSLLSFVHQTLKVVCKTRQAQIMIISHFTCQCSSMIGSSCFICIAFHWFFTPVIQCPTFVKCGFLNLRFNWTRQSFFSASEAKASKDVRYFRRLLFFL